MLQQASHLPERDFGHLFVEQRVPARVHQQSLPRPFLPSLASTCASASPLLYEPQARLARDCLQLWYAGRSSCSSSSIPNGCPLDPGTSMAERVTLFFPESGLSR